MILGRFSRKLLLLIFLIFMLAPTLTMALTKNDSMDTQNKVLAEWIIDQWYRKYNFQLVKNRIYDLPNNRLRVIRKEILKNEYVQWLAKFGASVQLRNHNSLMAFFRDNFNEIINFRIVIGTIVECTSKGSELTNCIMQTNAEELIEFSLNSATLCDWEIIDEKHIKEKRIILYMPADPRNSIALRLELLKLY